MHPQPTLRRIAVYCGSSDGSDPAYLAEAAALGRAIAAAGLGMVYGGANIGLMGAAADAALAGGAEVLGVLPDFLSGREIAHTGLTRLETVATMHQRKARMVALADAFLILPGGYGTLDELFEILTWSQLRMHAKPCILINTARLLGQAPRLRRQHGRLRLPPAQKPHPHAGCARRSSGSRNGPQPIRLTASFLKFARDRAPTRSRPH